MKVIYVAGPYRGKSEWEVTQNIRRAEQTAIECWKKGWSVICPHKNTAHFGGILPDYVWLEGDFEMIRRSDAICMIDGWQESVGAKHELEEAQESGLEIYYGEESVPDLGVK